MKEQPKSEAQWGEGHSVNTGRHSQSDQFVLYTEGANQPALEIMFQAKGQFGGSYA